MDNVRRTKDAKPGQKKTKGWNFVFVIIHYINALQLSTDALIY